MGKRKSGILPLPKKCAVICDNDDHRDVHQRVLKWRAKNDSTGKRWALAVDEPGKANIALLPDAEDMEHNLARERALWGVLMAGGYGVEWYIGYASPHSDLTCQDFRSRDLFWDQNRHARRFFEKHLPFWKMEPADNLTSDDISYCFANKGNVYAIYLPMEIETTSLNLSDTKGEFYVSWYNPREGGELIKGEVNSVKGGDVVALGNPPVEPEKDWVALVTVKK